MLHRNDLINLPIIFNNKQMIYESHNKYHTTGLPSPQPIKTQSPDNRKHNKLNKTPRPIV
jgi:hypothetical protein